jgi:hypothetical protein
MRHLGTGPALADLSERAHACAHGELLQLARVEIEEAQRQQAAAVLEVADQLPPAAILDVAARDPPFHQHGLARRRLGERVEPRLVVVAQRQVQYEAELAADAELGEAIQCFPAQPGKRRLRA